MQQHGRDFGRHVYGIGACALGIIGCIWGDFARVWQPIQAFGTVPDERLLAYVTAAGLIAGGVFMQWRRTAALGAALLVILNLAFTIMWLPRVIGFPHLFGTWGGLLQEFALVAAAVVVYASVAPHASPRVASFGCFLFGICVLSFAFSHFTALAQTAGMIPVWIPPSRQFWAVTTGVAHLLAGIAIVTGVQALLASRLLTIMFVVFSAFVWLPQLVVFPQAHMVWAGNAVNLEFIGAAWVVADAFAARSLKAPARAAT